MKISTIFKTGNSNAICIPKIIMDQSNLKKGDNVIIEIINDKIVLTKIDKYFDEIK